MIGIISVGKSDVLGFVYVTLLEILLEVQKLFGRYDTGIISSAESSGVCTNSDGESSKNGTLTNSSTANLSTDSACQNATEMLKGINQRSKQVRVSKLIYGEIMSFGIYLPVFFPNKNSLHNSLYLSIFIVFCFFPHISL